MIFLYDEIQESVNGASIKDSDQMSEIYSNASRTLINDDENSITLRRKISAKGQKQRQESF